MQDYRCEHPAPPAEAGREAEWIAWAEEYRAFLTMHAEDCDPRAVGMVHTLIDLLTEGMRAATASLVEGPDAT